MRPPRETKEVISDKGCIESIVKRALELLIDRPQYTDQESEIIKSLHYLKFVVEYFSRGFFKKENSLEAIQTLALLINLFPLLFALIARSFGENLKKSKVPQEMQDYTWKFTPESIALGQKSFDCLCNLIKTNPTENSQKNLQLISGMKSLLETKFFSSQVQTTIEGNHSLFALGMQTVDLMKKSLYQIMQKNTTFEDTHVPVREFSFSIHLLAEIIRAFFRLYRELNPAKLDSKEFSELVSDHKGTKKCYFEFLDFDGCVLFSHTKAKGTELNTGSRLYFLHACEQEIVNRCKKEGLEQYLLDEKNKGSTAPFLVDMKRYDQLLLELVEASRIDQLLKDNLNIISANIITMIREGFNIYELCVFTARQGGYCDYLNAIAPGRTLSFRFYAAYAEVYQKMFSILKLPIQTIFRKRLLSDTYFDQPCGTSFEYGILANNPNPFVLKGKSYSNYVEYCNSIPKKQMEVLTLRGREYRFPFEAIADPYKIMMFMHFFSAAKNDHPDADHFKILVRDDREDILKELKIFIQFNQDAWGNNTVIHLYKRVLGEESSFETIKGEGDTARDFYKNYSRNTIEMTGILLGIDKVPVKDLRQYLMDHQAFLAVDFKTGALEKYNLIRKYLNLQSQPTINPQSLLANLAMKSSTKQNPTELEVVNKTTPKTQGTGLNHGS